MKELYTPRLLLILLVTVFTVLIGTGAYNLSISSALVDNTEPVVLDYESQYYKMHCNAVADILARGGSNKTIKTYLEITGAKIQ